MTAFSPQPDGDPAAAACPRCRGTVRGGICPACLLENVLHPEAEETAMEDAEVPAPSALRLGGYELLEEIGRGGMGVVWRARQPRLQREVAVKFVLQGVLPGEIAAQRFRQEATVAAQLSHPHIIAVHEIGEADGRYFIAMELAAGGSLAEKLTHGPIPTKSAAALTEKLASALQHAHDRGVLHRDLKPANVLFDADGEPHLSDFGLARLANNTRHDTLAGSLLGTPSYMSPEQARGDVEGLSTAADIYGLGAILYEMLTGGPPFAGDVPVEVLRRVIDEEPPALRNTDADLATICLKCLRKQPGARYASSQALADDLARWREGRPIHARPFSAAERIAKWVRRHPALAMLWTALGVAACAIGWLVLHSKIQLASARGAAEASARASLHRQAHQATAAAVLAIERGDSLRALPSLAAAIRIGTGDPQRDRVNRIRFATCLNLAPELEQVWHPGWVENVQLAEALGCVLLNEGNRVRLLRFTDGQDNVPALNIASNASHLAFHPQLKLVVVETLQKHEIQLWDASTGQLRHQFPGRFLPGSHLFADGGTKLAIWLGDTARVVDLPQPHAAARELKHAGELTWACLSGDSSRILTCTQLRQLHVWDAASGGPIGQPMSCPPDSKFLAENSTARVAYVQAYEQPGQTIDLTMGQLATHRPFAGDIRAAHPWVAGTTFARSTREGFVVSLAESGESFVTATHGSQGNDALFSSSGDRVFTRALDGSGRLWSMSGKRAASPYLWQAGDPFYAALSPSADRIVVTDRNREVRLWKLRPLGGAVQKLALTLPGKLNEQLRDYTATASRQRSQPLHHQAGDSGMTFLTLPASNQILHLRHTPDGPDIVPPMQHRSRIIDAQLSSDHSRIATFTENQSVLLWDTSTGQQISPPLRHDREIQMIAFSPDGTLLLSIGAHTLLVWEAATGFPAAPPMIHAQPLWRAYWSTDGGTIHTVDNKGFQTDWNLLPDARPLDELAPVAHRLSAHHLTEHGALAPGGR